MQLIGFPKSIWSELSFLFSFRFWRDSTIAMFGLAKDSFRATQGFERLLVWLTIFVLTLSYFKVLPGELSFLELSAALTFAWSVRLLGKKDPDAFGWYIGNVGVILYIIIFFRVQLYGEIILMSYYLITDMIGINNWLTGTKNDPPPAQYEPKLHFLLILLAAIPATYLLSEFLIAIRGAAPLADALVTVLSMIANVMLAKNLVRSWYLWIVTDIIYIPLCLSRGLPVTTVLYIGLLILAINGLLNARRQANLWHNAKS